MSRDNAVLIASPYDYGRFSSYRIPNRSSRTRLSRRSRSRVPAIRFDQLLRDGIVAEQAELARLGHVTRARLTQIMNLLCLAPDLQEAILFLPPVERGRDPISEHELRPIAAVADWGKQRRMWNKVGR